jgi:hypothetical protein
VTDGKLVLLLVLHPHFQNEKESLEKGESSHDTVITRALVEPLQKCHKPVNLSSISFLTLTLHTALLLLQSSHCMGVKLQW